MKPDEKAPPRPGAPGRVLLTAAWFGLVVGLVEVCVIATRKIAFGKIIDISRDFPWMTPLGDLLFFSMLGAVLAAAALLWPRAASPSLRAFLFGLVAILGILSFYPNLHVLALLLLAAGIAAQIARAIGKHPAGFDRLVRRTTPLLAGLVLLLGVGVRGATYLKEQRALAQLPPAAPGAPNVLLLVLDTARAQNMSLYGYERPTTPELAGYAPTGVRFEHAISTAPWTLPSHASMFTGRWPHELSTDWEQRLDETDPTLAEVLDAHGYRTGGFVANAASAGYQQGLDRGFSRYEDHQVTLPQLVTSTFLIRLWRLVEGAEADIARPPQAERAPKKEPAAHRGRAPVQGKMTFLRPLLNKVMPVRRKSASTVHDQLLSWLDEDRERPFFAFLNYMEPHSPYATLPPFDTLFGPRWPEAATRENPHGWRVNAYDGALRTLDRELGRLFEELRSRRLLENTLVVVTSDHGELFGEHGLLNHGNSLYIQLLHVPLLISFPGRVPAGLSVPEYVTLRDLPATILDLVDIENGQTALPGTSLARFWEAGRTGQPVSEGTLLSVLGRGIRTQAHLPVSWGNMQSLVIDQMHYIKNGNGTEELYDLKTDPFEERNLVSRPEGQAALPGFRSELQALIALDEAPAAGKPRTARR